MANLEDLILRDTRVNQPAAGIPGRLYYVTDENILERDNGASWESVAETGGGAGSDTTAIHDNESGEINALTEKITLHDDDLVIIEDSEASFAKKKAKKSNIGGGGGGAPTDAEYVTTASNGDLSAEVVIPGLAGNADRSGIGGAGVSHEFDSGASPLTWSAAVDSEDVNTTFPSHLYIQDNGASETLGTFAWSPAGAFDIRCKASLGAEIGTSASAPSVGLIVGDSGMSSNRLLVLFSYDGSTDRFTVASYTWVPSTYTIRGAVNAVNTNCIYMRITRDGSNNISFYYSRDGLTWLLIATQAVTLTVAAAGLRLAPSSIVTNAAIDWIRSNV